MIIMIFPLGLEEPKEETANVQDDDDDDQDAAHDAIHGDWRDTRAGHL
jgi:hypothetical protein